MKLNPKNFQVIIDGKEKLVSECTLAELKQEMCYAIEILERIDAASHRQTNLIEEWRTGRKT